MTINDPGGENWEKKIQRPFSRKKNLKGHPPGKNLKRLSWGKKFASDIFSAPQIINGRPLRTKWKNLLASCNIFCPLFQQSIGRGIEYSVTLHQFKWNFHLSWMNSPYFIKEQNIAQEFSKYFDSSAGPLTFACKSSWQDWQGWYIS